MSRKKLCGELQGTLSSEYNKSTYLYCGRSVPCCNIFFQNIEGNKYIAIAEIITGFFIVEIEIKNTSGLAGKMFKLFSINNINVKMITTSEIRITCAISQKDKTKTIQIVAKEFNLIIF